MNARELRDAFASDDALNLNPTHTPCRSCDGPLPAVRDGLCGRCAVAARMAERAARGACSICGAVAPHTHGGAR